MAWLTIALIHSVAIAGKEQGDRPAALVLQERSSNRRKILISMAVLADMTAAGPAGEPAGAG